MEEYEAFEENDVQETDNLNIDDQVDFAQISLKSLIGKVNRTNIVEIWRVTYLTHKQKPTPHFIMICSQKAKFKQAFMDINGELSLMNPLTILSTLREDLGNSITSDINIKLKHDTYMVIYLELGVKSPLEVLNQVLEELCGDTNEIINESNRILNPHIVKSVNSIQENDGQGSSQNNNSGSKACSNCNATSHNIQRCIAPCKSCKKNGHTYVNCKGKNVVESNVSN
ncbi:hypothetical protein RhiirC2_770615 [Rhizophagus irregularis]|uniref:CCHC-type domain-containing protein n=1 Tax=Rhizophagus irregularis TaxID=588596 RepID=A0A2N1NW30_9GLOM|nr:hypothetical protein RhiirC2_770615 [Rhizophagus irregularis]